MFISVDCKVSTLTADKAPIAGLLSGALFSSQPLPTTFTEFPRHGYERRLNSILGDAAH
jgi:hypothetical protein